MHSLESPGGPRRRAAWGLLAGAAILAAIGTGFLIEREAPSTPSRTDSRAPVETDVSAPPDRSTTANAPAAPTERRPPEPSRPRRVPGATAATPEPAAPTTAAARELRVTADVAGAYVFLDRKFLGSTPLTTRDVTPGVHQLNVQVEGRPPEVRTVEVAADGPTIVEVTLAPAAAAAAFNASVAVVHQHGMGSCEGTLRATGDTLRYDTSHKDAFSAGLASIEQFSIDYQEKRLRVKARGRTWNFTTKSDTADPLFVFHRDVDAVRAK